MGNQVSSNNEYICNKIKSKTKIINDDLTLYNNNLDSIKIITINKTHKFIVNENIYKNGNINDIIINLTIILNDYVTNNFLIFDEDQPLINIDAIEKYIIKQCV
jgi:hypothetical protein